MKLALSSLAWDPVQDDVVRATLRRHEVDAIELAPLKYWPLAPDVPAAVLAEYAARWTNDGIRIVAVQAVLFGQPDLQLFGSLEQRAAFERHLIGIARLAGTLGASVIVLGAPRNRLRGPLSEEEAVIQAAPLLRRVAAAAMDHGCRLCVEPNPPRYGGDFACTTSGATRLVREVDHPGFALHLDAGALAIASETEDEILAAASVAAHFHVSEVDLAPLGAGTVDHRWLGMLLRRAGYDGWRSIEMRPLTPTTVAPGTLSEAIDRAIEVAKASYDG